MTTDTQPVPAPSGRSSNVLVILRWLLVVLLGVMGLGLLALATSAGPCPQGAGSPAFVLGVVLLGFAAILAGLPSLLIRQTPLRPSSPSWLKTSDGCAVVLGLSLALLTILVMPDLMPARISCNERGVISDLRAVLSAERAYSRVNGGFFDSRLSCLVRPAQCVPGLGADHPAFIDEQLTAQTRFGYTRNLIAGPAPSSMSPKASQTSVTSFACTASPVSPGDTGVRAFCADSSETICFTVTGVAPTVLQDGTCDRSDCTVLQ